LLPSRTPPTTNVGKDARKRDPHTLLVVMEAATTTMENNIVAPYKTRNRSAIQSSNPLLGIKLKE
jgi:hypothetical protein